MAFSRATSSSSSRKGLCGQSMANWLLALIFGNAGDDLDDERGEHSAVLAAAEADQPGARVFQIQVAEGVFNVGVTAGTH